MTATYLRHWPPGRGPIPTPEAYEPPSKTGWVCPVCGAGVAPWMASHCRKDKQEDTRD